MSTVTSSTHEKKSRSVVALKHGRLVFRHSTCKYALSLAAQRMGQIAQQASDGVLMGCMQSTKSRSASCSKQWALRVTRRSRPWYALIAH